MRLLHIVDIKPTRFLDIRNFVLKPAERRYWAAVIYADLLTMTDTTLLWTQIIS